MLCRALAFLALLLAAVLAVPVLMLPALAAGPAKEAPAPQAVDQPPHILRYVSLRSGKAYLRQGPGYAHKILWVYRHKGYPFAVINEFDAWRKLLAPDGTVGWMSSIVLSEKRTVLITGKGRVPITAKPGDDKVIALADPGAVASVKACTLKACRISGEGIDGWIVKARLWGVGKDEVFDN